MRRPSSSPSPGAASEVVPARHLTSLFFGVSHFTLAALREIISSSLQPSSRTYQETQCCNGSRFGEGNGVSAEHVSVGAAVLAGVSELGLQRRERR